MAFIANNVSFSQALLNNLVVEAPVFMTATHLLQPRNTVPKPDRGTLRVTEQLVSAKATIDAEERARNACFAALEAKLSARQNGIKSNEKIIITKRGISKIVPKSSRDIAHERKRKAQTQMQILAKSEIGPWGPEIRTLPTEEKAVVKEELTAIKWPLNATLKQSKPHKLPKPVRLTEEQMTMLIRGLTKIVKRNEGKIEITHKRTVNIDFIKIKKRMYARALVKHLTKPRQITDLVSEPFINGVIDVVSSVTQHNTTHVASKIGPGWSGVLLNAKKLEGNTSRNRGHTFVVRGQYNNKLFDARTKVSYDTSMAMQHFSSAGEKFWKGFNETFLKQRVSDRSHTCATNLDVTKCGEVAAIMCLALFPCGKITCNTCVDENLAEEGQASVPKMAEKARKAREILRTSYPEFKHAINIVERYERAVANVNENYAAFSEIQSIADGRTTAIFPHIVKLNGIMIKGAKASKDEFAMASNHLLEITRYMKNRTENIEKGSLKSFRNKISQKAHLNPTLMCDNQLDKNGNFVWGQRGYHAKRFFSNFFDVITPEDGYSKYVERKNPNGSRKLAINQLIVSTNFETLRSQMKGEPVKQHPITNECISLSRGDYVHACCCVTTDAGEPVYSELRLPTKRHLVIGNSGDSKYVDLPGSEEKTMYIAKNGKCYVNIFLAMLVNINEDDAKEFTKMTRDMLCSQLGDWPTVLDVATACSFLQVFYPEVSNAELPRILVDHETKTMHVVDSFGSLSTGYHILKANTVDQFTKFMRDNLESPMKHYRVGGDPLAEEITEQEASDPNWYLMKLVECIYKPKLLKREMIHNRYLPLYAMLSPGILLALYNSGTLEALTSEYLQKDHNLVVTLVILESLAKKVSKASSVYSQIKLLENGAKDMIEAAANIKQQHVLPYTTAMKMLVVLATKSESDLELDKTGFNNLRLTSMQVMEKSYLEALTTQWNALSVSEKFSVVLRSSKFSIFTGKELKFSDAVDLGGRCSESITSYSAHAARKIKQVPSQVASRCVNIVNKGKRRVVKTACSALNKLVPNFVHFINTLVVMGLLLTIINEAAKLVKTIQFNKIESRNTESYIKAWQCEFFYSVLEQEKGRKPTLEEYLNDLEKRDKTLFNFFIEASKEVVEHQSKRQSEQGLERIIGITALVLMIFDAERSDCVARILSKLKGIMSSVEPVVYHQSLDDIQDDITTKNLTIDFELDADDVRSYSKSSEHTFNDWWSHQLTYSRTIPHYRTEGEFMIFTRETAVTVANKIANSDSRDIMLMGAVGSGKSTGLPFHLAKKGNVLLIEPTKPLAVNVHKQLGQEPFYTNATLKMRGLVAFGSAPITIMTSGYALHYLANNRPQLMNFEFIIFDECHVHDANAMAFRCLLAGEEFLGKVIKVSATPPGREVEFTTQHKVDVLIEESISFQDFVRAQGSGSNADVVKHGHNILVYVASYNEVDMLSNMLIEKGYKVTKVDGRTMKLGKTEIVTSGNSVKKHFVVATNIIENGVTLDIEVVVDFGTKVVPILDSDNRMMTYKKVPVSYGERIQRLGRVGRHKPGVALRIGHTEKGLSEVPASIATEAAFYCFTYGLPVITNNVTTSLLANATVKQATTMGQFELTPFYTVNLVRFDGSVHPAIHEKLKPYKLRDSQIVLNKMAIPNKGHKSWLTNKEYNRLGANFDDSSEIRIPFFSKEVPEKLHIEMWDLIQKFKGDAGFGRLTSSSVAKVAYTLQTDVTSIQRTIKLIDLLIARERQNQEYFRSATTGFATSSFSLQGISNMIRSHFEIDHTVENISVLEGAKAQLLEFANLANDKSTSLLNGTVNRNFMQDFGALDCVYHQNEAALGQHLRLKGRWNKSLITRDVFVLIGVLIGGLGMVIQSVWNGWKEPVVHEGKGKRQLQKLKFRNARDDKRAREVYGNDETIAEYFGSAYTEKGKKSGTKKGMGVKTRKFINMYGFDPEDFTAVRFVDPLTGVTIDESPMTDISLVQEYLDKVRIFKIGEDELDVQQVYNKPNYEAYYMNKRTGKALKVDLSQHKPLQVCKGTIAGFPEREGELRQSAPAQHISMSQVPKELIVDIGVEHESASMYKGLRDYNPIANNVCKLTNESDGHTLSLYGVGYGPIIITNRHLFERNNGQLTILSRHGEFLIKNTTQMNLFPIPERDLLLLRLPKDVPPFPQKLQFRLPTKGERICLVGSNFQAKSITSLVSESSATLPMNDSHFWKHWISTKDGQCGSPLVTVTDGYLVGLHSLSNMTNTMNYFASFPENFKETYLDTLENHQWVKHWRYNTAHISWGALSIKESQPAGLFKTAKLVTDLDENAVYTQMVRGKWLYDKLEGNLKAIASVQSQLVTKHVVKGKCQLFDLYLRLNDKEREYFEPMLGQYQKSRLNKEAYIKDLMKYSTQIEVGTINTSVFEHSITHVIEDLKDVGFTKCVYVTDEESIFQALNMKSAVGALYSGKKRDFFKDYTPEMKEEIVKASCERLYMGKMGVWNGSLKAELRPIEKVEANKTRTFTAAPIDTLLGGKVCVDDFNNQFYDLNLKAPWSVGMTKFYKGWNELLSKLPDGWVYCDADGSQFDSSLSPYLINAVLNIRLSFMEDWDIGERMLENLYTEIVYTPISTPDGTLVKKFKGNNSGQPSTVVDNTLMVIIAMKYSLSKSGLPHELHKEICKFFVNGDDLLIGVDPKYEYILDGMSQNFLELGLKYTFDSRTRDKGDLWFMSHKGIKVDDIWIPKLEPERIVSILEWDRATEPVHRLNAICAAMIEAWGYPELLHEIRKFYQWLLAQEPYATLASEGKAPYIAEAALRKLYMDTDVEDTELLSYLRAIFEHEDDIDDTTVFHQASTGTIDAGADAKKKKEVENARQQSTDGANQGSVGNTGVTAETNRDRDINTGTAGNKGIPRLKSLTSKMYVPKYKGKAAMDLAQLLDYKPDQVELSNTRATRAQYDAWYEGVRTDYGIDDSAMQIIMNGLMVWCIENGTSPNINGMWVMMDGEEQVEYPIKPLIDHAKPTFRQIMAHFSNVAEAYIEMRNQRESYMPRYGLQRNLTDRSLARYAFDFYEITSKTPNRAREAHIQMKAAALRGSSNRMFGLDGNVGTTEEDTERHTTEDVSRNMHSLLGVRNM